jgi:hypothetical protein
VIGKGRLHNDPTSTTEIIYRRIVWQKSISMAALSKARTVFDRSNTEIVCSNSARGMDVCKRFSELCCPV